MPLGFVWYRRGLVSCGSKPTMRVEIPKGLTPPDCVYFCMRVEQVDAMTTCCTHLLDGRDVPGDVFNCDRVLYDQTVTLAFYSCFIDQDASIGSETCYVA